jgi:hypothetical protein
MTSTVASTAPAAAAPAKPAKPWWTGWFLGMWVAGNAAAVPAIVIGLVAVIFFGVTGKPVDDLTNGVHAIIGIPLYFIMRAYYDRAPLAKYLRYVPWLALLGLAMKLGLVALGGTH